MSTAAAIYPDREAWLMAAAESLRVRFDEAGRALPKSLRVTCGWPSRGGTASKRRVVGECWIPEVSADGTTELFIAPTLDQPRDVFAVLVHELIHASGVRNHRGGFVRMMKVLALTGKPTATEPGGEFDEFYGRTLHDLCAYPHAKLTPAVKPGKKQTARMHKASCSGCGYTLRLAAKWARKGLPVCVCGKGPLELDEPIEDGDDEEDAA